MMNNKILNMANRAKDNLNLRKHPLVQQDLEMKIGYLRGVALMMNVDEDIHELEKSYLAALVEAFGLDDSILVDVLIPFAQNPETEVFTLLMDEIKKRTEIKDFFMVDSILMAKKDGKLHKNEISLLKNYFEMLSFSSENEKKVRRIAKVINTKNKDKALALYLAFPDEDCYNKFSYLFDSLKFDSKEKRDKIDENKKKRNRKMRKTRRI